MRILAAHDALGNVRRLIVSPDDSPAAGLVPPPGLSLAELEASELHIDLGSPESLDRLGQELIHFRIDLERGARLIRKRR